MKTLSNVLGLIGINNDSNEEVLGITSDSRKVEKGFIFVALKGNHHNGIEFRKNAFKNGAIAILNEEIEDEKVYKVNNLTDNLSDLAAFIYDLDFSTFNVVGVTGTNGKSTSTSIIHQVLLKLKQNATLIGTNGVYYNEEHYNLNNTTPDLLTLYRIFYESKIRNINTIVMEVSSHSIVQNRIKGIVFNIIGFTNISHDHLDFHKTIENYALAKYQLVNYLSSDGTVFYNIDDELISKLYDFKKYNSFSYGIKSNDYKITNIRLSESNSSFFINNLFITSSLVCKFNVYNLSLAYLCLKQLGYKNSLIVKYLEKINSIEGRMQKTNKNNRHFYIDFAHSPDSIDKVLSFIKPLAKGKIIVVFGAGGDRDKKKRPKMLDACLKYADYVYVTSDNPRFEDPLKIIKDVIKNNNSFKVKSYLSRIDAINDAYKYSNPNDSIIILGKGNENYQIINDIKIPYNDFEVIDKCLLD